MPDHQFQVGDMVESRSFQVGFRGAWFRCKEWFRPFTVLSPNICVMCGFSEKIRGIRTKNTVMIQLEYFDYPDQKLTWIKMYQKPPTYVSKSKSFNRELMLRPPFPTIYHESEKLDVNAIAEVIVIVDNMWKVGDLVDWWTDGCYWSGRVTKILGNGKVQIDLLPPPLGEGLSYEAFSKDLRPSLDWCPEKGWTAPVLVDGGCTRPCARIINPANSDGTVKGCHPAPAARTQSSQNSENLLDFPDGSMGKRKQCNTASNSTEIEESNDTTISSYFTDASTENLDNTTINGDYNDEYPLKKMRSNERLCLNSMSSKTIEAAILDLEELVNRIRWLRGLLNFGLPLSKDTQQPIWEFLQHHAPFK